MQGEGETRGEPNLSRPMPATDDEIREKYLERAIRELNSLTRELQTCELCPRGNLMPVLGSGHPQADVMLLKFAPTASEVEEGVAFYGRAGNALMKALRRLQIDPLAVYGTLAVKCPVSDPSLAEVALGQRRLAGRDAFVAGVLRAVLDLLATFSGAGRRVRSDHRSGRARAVVVRDRVRDPARRGAQRRDRASDRQGLDDR